MRGKLPSQYQVNRFGDQKGLCNPDDRLIQLSEKIQWKALEEYFSDLYSKTGRPSQPES